MTALRVALPVLQTALPPQKATCLLSHCFGGRLLAAENKALGYFLLLRLKTVLLQGLKSPHPVLQATVPDGGPGSLHGGKVRWSSRR